MSVNDNGVLMCVAPPGGRQARISTNPLAIGVPTAEEPLVLDISTSMVANGKIRVAQIAGQTCPDGWLLDADGRPTNDPSARFADPPGTILPMGGYKGFGLGLMLDMLTGGLSGGFCPPAPSGELECNNVLLIAFDPVRFEGLMHFVTQSQGLADFVRETPPIDDSHPIRLPKSADAAGTVVERNPAQSGNLEPTGRASKSTKHSDPITRSLKTLRGHYFSSSSIRRASLAASVDGYFRSIVFSVPIPARWDVSLLRDSLILAVASNSAAALASMACFCSGVTPNSRTST
jgi:uncharacterized oxidoreductase